MPYCKLGYTYRQLCITASGVGSSGVSMPDMIPYRDRDYHRIYLLTFPPFRTILTWFA